MSVEEIWASAEPNSSDTLAGQPRPKLFATDLDGTFLDTNGEISELNFQAVQKAEAAGIPVVVATGRPLRILDAVDQLKELNPLVISCNGSVIKRLADDELIHLTPINQQLASEVIDDLRNELGGRINFAIEFPDGWAREPGYVPNPKFADAELIDDALALLDGPRIVKILVQADDLPTNILAELAAPITSERLTVTYSSIGEHGLLEIGPMEVTKASALQQILDDLGISAEDVAAFGDMPNDLEMLQLVGMPFRMAECHHLLEVADFPVAGSNADSGVGRTMLALLENTSSVE